MSQPVYQAFLLLTPEAELTVADVQDILRSINDRWQISLHERGVIVNSDEWEIHIALNEEPWVRDESQEIATALEDFPEAREIEQCDRRWEVHSHTPDPEMDYFNDYLFIVERLSRFPGVIAVDPCEPGLL